MKPLTLPTIALILGLTAGLARSDVIILKDGQKIRGRVVGESEDHIEIEWRDGLRRIARSSIAKRIRDGEELEVEGDRAAWRAELPAPHPSLSEDERGRLRAILARNRDRSAARRAAAKPGDEEAERIRALFARLGRSEGFDHLGKQNAARRKLKGFGLRNLELIAEHLDSANIHLRVNSLRLLSELAEENADWRWYLYHLDLDAALTEALFDESELGSCRIRGLANAILEEITGRSFGFEPNIKRRMTPTQARAARSWRDYLSESEAELRSVEELQREQYRSALELWTDGIKEPGALEALSSGSPSSRSS